MEIKKRENVEIRRAQGGQFVDQLATVEHSHEHITFVLTNRVSLLTIRGLSGPYSWYNTPRNEEQMLFV